MAKTYLIELIHTNEECLNALDQIVAQNWTDRCYMACMSGNHTGWATVEADDESKARNMLPNSLRGNARVTEVTKFTPDQIRSFHQMK